MTSSSVIPSDVNSTASIYLSKFGVKLFLVCSRSCPSRNSKFLLYFHLQIIQPPFCQCQTFIVCCGHIHTLYSLTLLPFLQTPSFSLLLPLSSLCVCVLGEGQPQLLCVLDSDDHALLRGQYFTTFLPPSCPYRLSMPSSMMFPGPWRIAS